MISNIRMADSDLGIVPYASLFTYLRKRLLDTKEALCCFISSSEISLSLNDHIVLSDYLPLVIR